jgi:hypothetical protein
LSGLHDKAEHPKVIPEWLEELRAQGIASHSRPDLFHHLDALILKNSDHRASIHSIPLGLATGGRSSALVT